MDAQGSARLANIILGAWLFISAFMWQHSAAQYTNAWVVGLLIAAVAIIGFWAPQVRYVNTALAAWLFISAWALPHDNRGTVWNHALVAIAVFAISLIPSRSTARTVSQTSTSHSPTMRDVHSTST